MHSLCRTRSVTTSREPGFENLESGNLESGIWNGESGMGNLKWGPGIGNLYRKYGIMNAN